MASSRQCGVSMSSKCPAVLTEQAVVRSAHQQPVQHDVLGTGPTRWPDRAASGAGAECSSLISLSFSQLDSHIVLAGNDLEPEARDALFAVRHQLQHAGSHVPQGQHRHLGGRARQGGRFGGIGALVLLRQFSKELTRRCFCSLAPLCHKLNHPPMRLQHLSYPQKTHSQQQPTQPPHPSRCDNGKSHSSRSVD